MGLCFDLLEVHVLAFCLMVLFLGSILERVLSINNDMSGQHCSKHGLHTR